MTHHRKRELMGIAKSIDPGQPVQSMQADHGQNFSLLADFLCINHYQMTNFRLFQTERVCRRQFQILRKWQKAIQMGRKPVGKGEIAHYKQFLLFPQCFLKACFPGGGRGIPNGVIGLECVK